MSERHTQPRVFPDLEPPRGGLARLRTRLDEMDGTHTARTVSLAFLPAFAAAAIAVVLVTRAQPSAPALPDHPSLTIPANATAVVASGLRVPLSEHATLYWVP